MYQLLYRKKRRWIMSKVSRGYNTIVPAFWAPDFLTESIEQYMMQHGVSKAEACRTIMMAGINQLFFLEGDNDG